MATWYRPRSLRTGRSIRHRRDSEDEIVQLDLTKDLSENVKEVLCNVVKRHGVTKAKKLAYLNAFVKLCEQLAKSESFGFTAEEMFCCLRVALLHEAKEVRAAGLRAIRYLFYEEKMIDAFFRLQGHHLVCRSLDIVLDNQIEHVQAIRLMRKVLSMCPKKYPLAFVNCLLAIANDGMQEKDKLLRVCLATLSELAVLNIELCAESGIVGSLLKNALNCHLPRINEALVGTVIYLMNHPSTRRHVKMGIDLEQVLAPYTDCHYRPLLENFDHSGDDRESNFLGCKFALLSILRSWPGMIRLCKPDDSGMKSLVEVLYLPNADVRKGVMELLFTLFRLPLPEWTDDFPIALLAADPSNYQESWKLYEGFVAEEGCTILPYIAECRTNLIENYLALLLLAFINNGILEALVEVIITSDSFVMIRATILLGELLHLATKLLPHECNHHSQCLPTLVAVAASFEVSPQQRHVASAAITYLNALHNLKKRGAVPCTLFLDQLVQFSSKAHSFQSNYKVSRTKLLACVRNDSDDFVTQAIKDTQVMNFNRDYNDWDWMLIDALFKTAGVSLKKLEDNTHKLFIRKIVHFYKPTSKLFSRQDLSKSFSRIASIVGSHLMDFLVEAEEAEAMKFLEEFLTDFGLCLGQVTAERSPLDAILCPNRVLNTNCQHYFLFIGRLSHYSRGRKALERTNIFQYFLDLVSITSHDCYNKLIVSSLDYTKDGLPRIILTKILISKSEASRLYATNFLRVLVRLRLPEFHKWGIELLVTQLYDKSRSIALAALEVLDEACESRDNLEAIVNLRPSLLHLGDRGLLLLIRFLSIPCGFKFLLDANFAANELERWKKSYNLKYVRIVEDELNDSLTHHHWGRDGTYRRRSSQKQVIRDVFVPHHLYGQLVQHKPGLELLRDQGCLVPLIEQIKQPKFKTPEQILELKAALWALGHIGTSEDGIIMLNNGHAIPEIVKFAEECPVYAIRGTCFYVLGLLASTRLGADLLGRLGWESLRHSRSEMWPLVVEPDLLFMDDSFSSVGSLSSQLAEIDLDDACSGILSRLDEDDSNGGDDDIDELKSESNSEVGSQKAHFSFTERNDTGAGDKHIRTKNHLKRAVLESSSVEPKRSWSPISKGEEVVLRKNSRVVVEDTSSSELSVLTHVISSPTNRLVSSSKLSYHKWSHTLPLARTRPSTIAETVNSGNAPNEISCGRQRSRSVTQRPHIAEGVIEAWERRNRIPGSETNCCSIQSSPRGSTRIHPKLKIASRERVRSKSFTEPCLDIDLTTASSVMSYRIQRHLRSSSNVEIAHIRVNPIFANGVQSEYGDAHITFPNTSFKDRRSDSNESSRTSTSKSRSNSCTDSTSGISSGESSNVRPLTSAGQVDRPQLLSPIASSSSLNTMSGHTVHHSDPTRKLVNLRKTPVVLCRVSTPINLLSSGSHSPIQNFPLGPSLSPDMNTLETSFVYTTTRDAQGYATLRSLQQRRRGYSTCVPPEQKILEYNLRSLRTRSLDSRLELPRLLTCDSLSSLGQSNFDRQTSLSHSISTQRALSEKEEMRFVGLCLPVDISMIFNEDSKENRQFSSVVGISDSIVKSELEERPVILRSHMDRDPLFDENVTDGLELHKPATCLGCYRVRHGVELTLCSQQNENSLENAVASDLHKKSSCHYDHTKDNSYLTLIPTPSNNKSRTSSSETSAGTTPGSVSSIGSCEPGSRRLTEDSLAGKALLRKEVLRFIINLSSSVATKSAEQGLLNLKQKFPNAFHDLCLYSEISDLVALYRFRLSARRFIQELFMDMSFIELYDEPMQILGLCDATVSVNESNA